MHVEQKIVNQTKHHIIECYDHGKNTLEKRHISISFLGQPRGFTDYCAASYSSTSSLLVGVIVKKAMFYQFFKVTLFYNNQNFENFKFHSQPKHDNEY